MNRRAPLLAAIGTAALALLALLLLVFPKQHAVSQAKGKLDQAKQQEALLQNQLQALRDAKANAPQYHRQIRHFQTLVPPLADLPGLINLTQNIADRAGVDLAQVNPGAPTLDASGTFSTIPTSINVKGTFFTIVEFIQELETLPRAAKVTTINVAGQQTSTVGPISVQLTVEFYTSDTSSGPGSVPGPNEAAAGAGATPAPGA